MTALLPKGDEFRMIFEGLDVLLRNICCFAQHFSELGVNFIENVAHSSFETLEAASGRLINLWVCCKWTSSSQTMCDLIAAWRGMVGLAIPILCEDQRSLAAQRRQA
jgi:hypothetical protein